jgi:hypothetical protein
VQKVTPYHFFFIFLEFDMFFVGLRTRADLSLTTPLEICCNCAARRPIELVETPLQRTRYFLFFGTELTLNETFPYCQRCKSSAKRVRLGWASKLLSACLAISIVFLALVFAADSFPKAITENMFRSSVILGIILTLGYFYLREWGRKGSTYYQPVSLASVNMSNDTLNRLVLKFYNKKYAKVFAAANADIISSGMLKIEVAGENAT